MLHDTFAVVLGGDGCYVVTRLTLELKDRVSRLCLLRHNVGYLMRPLLVVDWHVRLSWVRTLRGNRVYQRRGQASHGLFGVGASNTHYMDKCVLVRVVKDEGELVYYDLVWISKINDYKLFAEHASTAKERMSLDEITDTCLCLTRSCYCVLSLPLSLPGRRMVAAGC